jgi:hypothetical protein
VTPTPRRPDLADRLREARAELERIEARARQCYDQARVASDLPGRHDHEYLTAQLEAAHAHMVGATAAERALLDTLGRPRPRDAWRRDEAEYLFGAVVRNHAYHATRLDAVLDHVTGWIRQFGRPEPPGTELEAER